MKGFSIIYSNYDGINDFEIKNGNGKGNEYDYEGKVVFEGEYLNGKKNGKGKEYFNNGLLKFEGEYFEGKRKESEK